MSTSVHVNAWTYNIEVVTTQQYEKKTSMSRQLYLLTRGKQKISVILMLLIHFYKLIIQMFLISH